MYEHIVQESTFSDLFRFHSVTNIFGMTPFPVMTWRIYSIQAHGFKDRKITSGGNKNRPDI